MPDVDGFDEFYRSTRQRLLRYVYLLTGDLAETQDAVQEAYMRAWQRWSTVSGYADPEAWMRVVAARLAISRWRSLRRRLQAHVRHGGPGVVPPPGTETVEVVTALRQLPEDQRVTIALYYLMGMPVAEVARELDVPLGTVKARLSRGRSALAGLLAERELEVADV
ncbi:RNA polymerase sigma factor [Micromonospora globbae]|uniref:SigE family RNA polymerase sigma factor n=1 Tax=Micromonospora globbae TaxID=1894969 RepID=A0A420EQB2_9ACTN|nr:sigma factor-like helix-turn-helix DNA-binding protein [Micromonospora globbae]RKF22863.1 SigE family RNA polymerase sigma factor [Micromonospora globbae]